MSSSSPNSETSTLLARVPAKYSTYQVPKDSIPRKRWNSITLAYAITLNLAVGPPIYATSLYQFLYALDPGTTSDFYSYTLMSFYIAAAIASLVYGWLTNYLKQTKIFIATALFFNVIGSLTFTLAPMFHSNQRTVILIGRVFTGLAYGILGDIAAFVIMESTESERRFAVSTKCAFVTFAGVVGPAVQLCFWVAGGKFTPGSFTINVFTGPTLLSAVSSLILIPIVLRWFSETWVAVARHRHRRSRLDRRESAFISLETFDKLAAGSLVAIRCIFDFVKGYIDSVQSPLTMTMFDWDSEDAILYNGIIAVAASIVGTVLHVLNGNWLMQHSKERFLLLLSVISVILFFAISFPTVQFAKIATTEGGETKKCTFDWCITGNRLSLPAYLAGYTFLAIGYGLSMVPNCILYSRVLGPRKQGLMQGLYNGISQVVLVFGPISNVLLQLQGASTVWIVGLSVMFAGLILVICSYRRLVPFRSYD